MDHCGKLIVRVLVGVVSMSAMAPALDTTAASFAERDIRELRHRSNTAIAAHDAATAVTVLSNDAQILASSGALISGALAMQRAFERSFSDPAFITYRRLPERIELGTNGVAAEHGKWSAEWKAADGTVLISGPYLARWRHQDGRWRITGEQFIRLQCTGSTDCSRR